MSLAAAALPRCSPPPALTNGSPPGPKPPAHTHTHSPYMPALYRISANTSTEPLPLLPPLQGRSSPCSRGVGTRATCREQV